MFNRLSRPALALSATAITALMLTACGSDDAPSVSAPSETASAASTPASTPSAPESTAPQEDPTTAAPEPTTEAPTVAPSTAAPSEKASKAPKAGNRDVVGNKKKFQVTMPKGWHDIQDKLGASQMKIIELAIADGLPSNKTLTNINVASIKLNLTDTSAVTQQSAKKYKDQGESVKMLPQRKVAGETANGYTKQDKKKTQSQTQLFLSHKGTVYIITLTNSPKSASSANKALDQMIGSWTWR